MAKFAVVQSSSKSLASSALRLLRETYVFRDVPEDALQRLAHFSREERFERETVICAAGERLDLLRCITAGSIRPTRISKDGVAVSTPPMMRGAWATWPGVFCDPPVPHDLVADAGTQCVAFPAEAVRDLAIAHPEIYRRVIEEIGAMLRGLMTLVMTTGADDEEQALARAVLAGCRAASPLSDGPVTIEMTQEQVGRIGFGSRQRVARLLRSLEKAGVLTARYGQIVVPSQKRLEAYLGEPPASRADH